MRKKKSLLGNWLFDKKKGRKSGRGRRQKSGTRMSDGKSGTQRRAANGVEQATTSRSQQTDVTEWQRLGRALKKEIRNFERVMAKEQHNLK